MRLGVLVSGRGSNLGAMLEAGLPVTLVVSNRDGVRALDVARAHGVPAVVLARSDYADADARDRAIGAALSDAGVELAVLAGYDRLLGPGYFATYPGRTINIHPSLLPAHGGAGMVGLAVHRAVLAAGDRETGATVHEVTADLDAGPVLAQARVPVLAGDDADALAARVLAEEHRLLVATIGALASDGWPRPGDLQGRFPNRPPGTMRASITEAQAARREHTTQRTRPGRWTRFSNRSDSSGRGS